MGLVFDSGEKRPQCRTSCRSIAVRRHKPPSSLSAMATPAAHKRHRCFSTMVFVSAEKRPRSQTLWLLRALQFDGGRHPHPHCPIQTGASARYNAMSSCRYRTPRSPTSSSRGDDARAHEAPSRSSCSALRPSPPRALKRHCPWGPLYWGPRRKSIEVNYSQLSSTVKLSALPAVTAVPAALFYYLLIYIGILRPAHAPAAGLGRSPSERTPSGPGPAPSR